MTITSKYQVLTAIATETQKALQLNKTIESFTQEAEETATQQYLFLLQTAQASWDAKKNYNQALEQVATKEAKTAEVATQLIISTDLTSTADVFNQRVDQILGFVGKLPDITVAFFDTFENNTNGWSPENGDKYIVSLKDDELKIKVLNPSSLPFVWTCEKCNSINKFSFQIDIKTPKGLPGIKTGIIFGATNQLYKQQINDYYALLIYSTGDIVLERFSSSGEDIIKVWEHIQDLITPDGQFHTLQIVGIDNYAAVYLDNKIIGDVFPLEYSTRGYSGLMIQSSDVDVIFDNMKIVQLP